MFKDECGGKIIDEFVGLRAKLYSYRMFNRKENKRCKGIKKNVIEDSISHKDYRRCLFDKEKKEKYREMHAIRSYKHKLYTERICKVALSSNDDKRFVLDNKRETLAWGHYKIKIIEEEKNKKLSKEEKKKYEQQGARPKTY